MSGGPGAHEGVSIMSRSKSTSCPTICSDAPTNASIAIELTMAELSDVLLDVWSQVLLHDSNIVKLGLEQFPVSASKKNRFRQVEFSFGGKMIVGIQQNPDTKSNWAKMARSGIKVMQFIQDGRYIAVVAAGKVTMYGSEQRDG
jgi:hypothetical protein